MNLLLLQQGNIIGFKSELYYKHWLYTATDSIFKDKPPRIDDLFPGWELLCRILDVKPMDEISQKDLGAMLEMDVEAVLKAEELMERKQDDQTV